MTAKSGAEIGSGLTSKHYPSYQSVPFDLNAGTASAPKSFPRRLPLRLGAASLLVAVMTTIVGILLIDRPRLFLSPQYAELIQDNFASGVPILGSSRSEIRAQSIAEQYRLDFLNNVDGSESHSKHNHEHKHKNKTRKGKKGSISKEPSSDEVKTPVGCEATIVLLRHCEKESEYEHCNYVGYERAAFLPTLFGDFDERWPTPSYIFALNPGDRGTSWKKNFREVELILPLAEKANVTIDAAYGIEDTSQLAKDFHRMLKNGKACGKLAVVSWKHEDLPRLARRLGCGPIEGCPVDYHGSTFDEVWQIKFVYRIPIHATTKHDAKRDINPRKASWWVYGSTQLEGFDPLKFSKEAGDYPKDGKESGASWMFDFEDDPRWEKIERAPRFGRLRSTQY
jgi:hypothetical protein